jgi:hypothetical protein
LPIERKESIDALPSSFPSTAENRCRQEREARKCASFSLKLAPPIEEQIEGA